MLQLYKLSCPEMSRADKVVTWPTWLCPRSQHTRPLRLSRPSAPKCLHSQTRSSRPTRSSSLFPTCATASDEETAEWASFSLGTNLVHCQRHSRFYLPSHPGLPSSRSPNQTNGHPMLFMPPPKSSHPTWTQRALSAFIETSCCLISEKRLKKTKN